MTTVSSMPTTHDFDHRSEMLPSLADMGYGDDMGKGCAQRPGTPLPSYEDMVNEYSHDFDHRSEMLPSLVDMGYGDDVGKGYPQRPGTPLPSLEDMVNEYSPSTMPIRKEPTSRGVDRRTSSSTEEASAEEA
jgi:hypothetical protein